MMMIDENNCGSEMDSKAWTCGICKVGGISLVGGKVHYSRRSVDLGLKVHQSATRKGTSGVNQVDRVDPYFEACTTFLGPVPGHISSEHYKIPQVHAFESILEPTFFSSIMVEKVAAEVYDQ